MDKIKLEKIKIDNSVSYNYRDEDTLYFVNFKNLLATAICLSYGCTFLFATFMTDEGMKSPHVAIGIIIAKYSLYIFVMIFQIFTVLNYRFLIIKRLKKFSWISCIFISVHSAFYIIILNVMLIGGPNFVSKMLE